MTPPAKSKFLSVGDPRGWLDLPVQDGGEPHSAHQPQVVFLDAADGMANGTEKPGLEIGFASDEVDHFITNRTVKESVDCEVPALRVFFRRGVGHHPRLPAIFETAIGPESGYLDMV